MFRFLLKPLGAPPGFINIDFRPFAEGVSGALSIGLQEERPTRAPWADT